MEWDYLSGVVNYYQVALHHSFYSRKNLLGCQQYAQNILWPAHASMKHCPWPHTSWLSKQILFLKRISMSLSSHLVYSKLVKQSILEDIFLILDNRPRVHFLLLKRFAILSCSLVYFKKGFFWRFRPFYENIWEFVPWSKFAVITKPFL